MQPLYSGCIFSFFSQRGWYLTLRAGVLSLPSTLKPLKVRIPHLGSVQQLLRTLGLNGLANCAVRAKSHVCDPVIKAAARPSQRLFTLKWTWRDTIGSACRELNRTALNPLTSNRCLYAPSAKVHTFHVGMRREGPRQNVDSWQEQAQRSHTDVGRSKWAEKRRCRQNEPDFIA